MISIRSFLILFLSVTFIVGCTEPPSTQGDIYVIGDSLCDTRMYDAPTWASMLGLSRDCKAGRSIFDVAFVPEAELTIIALGTNDTNKPLFDFKQRYERVLDKVSGEAVCLLPNDARISDAIRSICAYSVESVSANHSDGIHYRQSAQVEMKYIVSDVIDSFEI